MKLSPTGAVTKTMRNLCMAELQVQDNYSLMKKNRLGGAPQPVFVTSGFTL
ncbi:hypothetical protein [Acidocella sp.]|uniref:hypothetical protein n=1 Tax=Acidocella sp. TaxID=50710 RepID=UPI00182D2665|nr:hypothetical protein [Acidocella sp.]NNM57059.1 hypothetical protein [Acidocella sp.]